MTIFDKQQPSPIDFGPTIDDIDRDLRDESDAMLRHYGAQFDPAQIGGRSWEATPIEQKRALRANNELARRENEKKRAAARAAEDAKAAAWQAAQIEARISDYKAQVRGAWIGDQASFDAAWPALLQQWQIDQARAAISATYDRIRARVGHEF